MYPSTFEAVKANIPISQASAIFLTLDFYGEVPPPSGELPSQLQADGFEGMVRMLEDMWPNAKKVFGACMLSEETPSGWIDLAGALEPRN